MLNTFFEIPFKFIPLDLQSPTFFGFSQFLTILALMILAWTFVDIRYRFRVMISPFPLHKITFYIVVIIGFGTLALELWRAQQWLFPVCSILNYAALQAIFGGSIFATFLLWVFFAFIKPPTFNRMNAKRFTINIYKIIRRGASSDLPAIADELRYSSKSLIKHASDSRNKNHNIPKIQQYANSILLLIADKRFCKTIIESSADTALSLFTEMTRLGKYPPQVKILAKNLTNEGLLNRNSFLYHEIAGYESGLIGDVKPFTKGFYSNYQLVEKIGTAFHINFDDIQDLNSYQLDAYCRALLLTFDSYVRDNIFAHSFVITSAINIINNSINSLYEVNGHSGTLLDLDILRKLNVVNSFIIEAIKILDKIKIPKGVDLRIRDTSLQYQTIYDDLAKLVFNVIYQASSIKSPTDTCWSVQYNKTWSMFFNFSTLTGPAAKFIKHKVRRLLYNEIIEMSKFPNYKGARILRICLNVMGLKFIRYNHENDTWALKKSILEWTKKNYVELHKNNSSVADACLVDGISYDKKEQKLVKVYPGTALSQEPKKTELLLDLPTSGIS